MGDSNSLNPTIRPFETLALNVFKPNLGAGDIGSAGVARWKGSNHQCRSRGRSSTI